VSHDQPSGTNGPPTSPVPASTAPGSQDLRQPSVGTVMTGFGGSPFADSANDSFAKSNSDSSIPRILPASQAPSDSLI